METYREFLDRILSFEKKEISFGKEDFKSNPSLSQKVKQDNSFRNFYGDTVVFTLDDAAKKQIADYADRIRCAAPHCFCEKLGADTFHLTLHDLSNSPSLQAVEKTLAENQCKIRKKAAEMKKLGAATIQLKSTCIFNMVNTSLVLGLYPADAEQYSRLIDFYSVFDDVQPLPYPFTPHVTLAYYYANGFDLQAAEILERTVNQLNRELDMELTVHRLVYQHFRSMNDYSDILQLTK